MYFYLCVPQYYARVLLKVDGYEDGSENPEDMENILN